MQEFKASSRNSDHNQEILTSVSTCVGVIAHMRQGGIDGKVACDFHETGMVSKLEHGVPRFETGRTKPNAHWGLTSRSPPPAAVAGDSVYFHCFLCGVRFGGGLTPSHLLIAFHGFGGLRKLVIFSHVQKKAFL